MKRVMAAVLAVLTAVTLASCSSSKGSSGSSGGSVCNGTGLNDQVSKSCGQFDGIGLVPAQPRPSFTLTDTEGKPFSFGSQTANTATLLYFGYTRCPDICPETMANIGLALKSLKASEQKQVDVVFVSTDVKHDTSAIISEWLKNFSTGLAATFIGLRGTQAQIDAAQTVAHVTVAEDDGETHSTEVLLFGANNYAEVSYAFNGTAEQKQIAHDLPLVLKG